MIYGISRAIETTIINILRGSEMATDITYIRASLAN